MNIEKTKMDIKAWGLTCPLLVNERMEVHALSIRKGGFCSVHRHRKWNLFYVVSGELDVLVFGIGESPAPRSICDIRYNLQTGDTLKVPPGVWHQFRAVKESSVIEAYWIDLDANDIERASEGGMSLVHFS